MQQGSSAADTAHEAAGFTGRFTAGLRFVESTCVPHPLIRSDPLAGVLAGERGLALAKQELEQLIRDQGPGKHLRVPARSRLIDDELETEIAALMLRREGPARGQHGSGSESGSGARAGTGAGAGCCCCCCCQVVSLGAGMCTRPWRLACLAPCRTLEVDLPHIAATKAALLREADAQMTRRPPSSPPSCGGGAPQAAAAAAPPDAAAFPLVASSYACVGLDLSATDGGGGAAESLARALAGAGFDSSTPTVWVLEALLYYMPLRAADELLCGLAGLSAPGSRVIATCVDRELLVASQKGVPKGHVFADLWHFDTEALLYDTRAFGECWQIDWSGQPEAAPEAEVAADGGGGGTAAATKEASTAAGVGDADPHRQRRRRLPASTRRLAEERLGADTYVALYGGSELLFAAGLRPPRQQ